ncbi:MAG TPA: bifunctional riboflavin kinase/FAD synthetase [Candidatus Aminicenantes bacterium]|nr:bifunctional riboflavin kinase/FAD synthetase [Candidatus Aminicenantes bacterium]
MHDPLPSAVAIGNFDGFHLGHQELIRRLRVLAQKRELAARVVTFRPNPKVYFGRSIPLIFTDEQKARMLESQKVDEVIFQPFSQVAHLSAKEFVCRFLIPRLSMRALVVGENFRFGAGRTGDTDFLQRIAFDKGFHLEVVPSLTRNKGRVSSSRIRELLIKGVVDEAAQLLGRHYFIDGIVVSGAGRGRKLGFPTINLNTENQVLPQGVFATRVEWKDQFYPAVTNIGLSPTFSRSIRKVETHIIDFDRQIYHNRVRLHFLYKLRDEFRFDTASELIAQIRRDVRKAFIDKV